MAIFMDFYLFDRTEKIIHFDDLGALTPNRKISGKITAVMSQNEIYVIQIAAISQKDDVIRDIKFKSSDLKIECINTDITDKFGNRKKQSIDLKSGVIQPLFFTIEAEHTGPRTTFADFCIKTQNEEYNIACEISVNDTKVENNGYNDLYRLSRLKWLNSTIAQDDTLVKPFISPKYSGNTAAILGREIEFSSNGLPKQVFSMYDESVEICKEVQKTLFAKPCEFNVGNETLPPGKKKSDVYNNRIETETAGETEFYKYKVTSTLRYEGMIQYSIKITPVRDFTADNVSLDMFIDNSCTSLMHGLGHRASKAQNLEFKWDSDKHQDCIFIGAVNCGVRVKFKAEDYTRPLINIFYKNLPLKIPCSTWDNNSNGKIVVSVTDKFAKISAYTGTYNFVEGVQRSFDFELHITPFKPIDYKKAFSVRYSHSNKLKDEYKEIDDASKHGLNYVTFHQGNMIMPYINYPFYETDRLKKAVKYAKNRGIGIKLYYTQREHSNHMAETFVYKALGDEIILRKQGVSHSWQKEKPQWLVDNFGEDIIPGWFVKYKHGKYKGEHDISFIVRPDTRLDNYYAEGLNWLIENVGISGIYIDDTSLDRTTLERAKKLLDKKDGLIDMHMWNHEEPRAGDVSCLNLYAELLAFLDSIWLGEGFFYKKYSPEYMLAEVSGIPYGITGQMLQDGGDLYEGLLYGMNNRYGWGYKNAVDMYKVWDEFGIDSSKMLGYWHSAVPIKTDNENVLATVYLKKDSALVSIYNFSFKTEKYSLKIDRNLLGFDPLKAVRIKFGSELKRKADLNKKFKLGKRSGALLLITE